MRAAHTSAWTHECRLSFCDRLEFCFAHKSAVWLLRVTAILTLILAIRLLVTAVAAAALDAEAAVLRWLRLLTGSVNWCK